MTLGLRHLRNRMLYTFGENLQNINKTPDIGIQLGVAFIPIAGKRLESAKLRLRA